MVGALILLVVGGKMRILPYLPSKNKAPASVVLIELDFILRKASRGWLLTYFIQSVSVSTVILILIINICTSMISPIFIGDNYKFLWNSISIIKIDGSISHSLWWTVLWPISDPEFKFGVATIPHSLESPVDWVSSSDSSDEPATTAILFFYSGSLKIRIFMIQQQKFVKIFYSRNKII